MFENRFNTRKTDPLVEAVKQAQADGGLRRQAEAAVNEAFGVYSRKAVVREHLNAYDAALEEAYKCMKEGEKWEGSKEDRDEDAKLAKKHGMTMKQWEKSAADNKHDAKEKMDEAKDEKKEKEDKPKSDYSKMREKMVGKGKDLETTRKIVGEAKKLAKKDYDKDGKVESPKDEVWGSRLRAAKMAGKLKEEEQIDEISKELAGRYAKKASKDASHQYGRAQDSSTQERRLRSFQKGIKRSKGHDLAIDKLTGKAKVPANEEIDYSAQDRAPVTKSAPKEDPSTPKVPYSQLPKTQNRAGAVIDSAKGSLKEAIATAVAQKMKHRDFKETRHPNPGAVTKAPVPGVSIAEQDQFDEAAYSAKAARAGKDIGKPGKMFSKIAAKAGKKYGSAERGKAVAGAVLKRIRAKHMEEGTQIDELSAFGKAFAAAKGQNFSFGGKQYSGARADGKTSAKTSSVPSVPKQPGAPSETSTQSFLKSQGVGVKPPEQRAAPSMSMMDPKAASIKPTAPSAPVSNQSAASGNLPSMASGLPGSTGAKSPTLSPVAPKPMKGWSDPGAAENKARATGSLKEEVQVGETKYRIV